MNPRLYVSASILAGLVGLAILFSSLYFIGTKGGNSSPRTISEYDGFERDNEIALPSNAFVSPTERNRIIPFGSAEAETYFGTSQSAPSLSFDQVEKFVSAVTPDKIVPARAADILELPHIPTAEFTILPEGPSTTEEYLIALNTSSEKIQFSYASLNSVMTGREGTPLFAAALVETMLSVKSYSNFLPSLLGIRAFMEAKVAALMPTRIAPALQETHATVMGFDKLSIELLDKAIALAESKIDASSVELFFKKYTNSIAHYGKTVRVDVRAEVIGGRNFARSFFESIGFIRIARAVGLLPFGGLITLELPCPCQGGVSLTLTPPPGLPPKVFITYATLSSPLLFAYKSPHPGAYILGGYTAGAPACWVFIPNGCAPIDFPLGTVLMAGTSL